MERLKERISNINALIDLADKIGVQIKNIRTIDVFRVVSLIKKSLKFRLF
jgi:hypothetical protein